jgi:hypothetical protein
MVNSEDENSDYEKLHPTAAGVGPLYSNSSAIHNNTAPHGEPDHDMDVTDRNLTKNGHYYLN